MSQERPEEARDALEEVRGAPDLPPSMRLLVDALSLVLGDSARGWDEVTEAAMEELGGEELLEVLYVRARAAARAGDAETAARWLGEVEGRVEETPIWKRRAQDLRRML